MQIKITGFEKLVAVVRKIDARLADTKSVMAPIAELVKTAALQRFVITKTAPDGTPWKAVSQKYLRRKLAAGRTSGTLILTGALRDSLRSGMTTEAETVTAWVTAGLSTDGGKGKAASIKYAARQQKDRPFLGVGKAEEEIVRSAFENWLRRLG